MKKILLFFILIIIGIVYVYKYNKDNSINIGFVAGLSGKYSNLGHDVLNGVSLAFEENGYKVNNKSIHLITKDDKQNENSAKNAMEFFLNQNINLIIGNATSSMTKISIPYVNDKENTFLISPTASSNEFSNIDDSFLRTQVAHSTKRFDDLSKYLIDQNLTKVYMVFDPLNKSYVDNYLINFQSSFISNGGTKFISINKITDDFEVLVNDIIEKDANVITIVANSVDSAKFIQFLKLKGINKKIISSGWAKTKDFLESGGSAVEGVVFSTGYDDNSNDTNYINFVNLYKEKFLKEPSIFAAQSYETGMIVYEVLKNIKDVSEFKSYILSKKTFNGLQGKITFNEYGDVEREYFLMKVKDNKFKRIESTNE